MKKHNSIFDKVDRREILNGAGNQLQAFQDRGQYWDAWNIDLLSAFKKALDADEKKGIVCFYQTHGLVAELTLKSDWEIFWDRRLDLLERPLKCDRDNNLKELKIQPWKIVTLTLVPGSNLRDLQKDRQVRQKEGQKRYKRKNQ